MKSYLLTLAMLLLMVGCAQVANPAPSQKYATAGDIQAEYERNMEKLNLPPGGRDYFYAGLRTMQKIINEAGEEVRQRELARLSAEQVDVYHNDFDAKLLSGLFDWYCVKGDTATLESLLAKNCPGDSSIPLGLARLKQPEGMLVLTKAYFDAGDKPSAHVIALQLRAAFDSWQKPGQTDAEFVRAIEMTWTENYANYIIKSDSPLLGQGPFTPPGAKSDIFILKSTSEPNVQPIVIPKPSYF
jgi:hypothetical protein